MGAEFNIRGFTSLVRRILVHHRLVSLMSEFLIVYYWCFTFKLVEKALLVIVSNQHTKSSTFSLLFVLATLLILIMAQNVDHIYILLCRRSMNIWQHL